MPVYEYHCPPCGVFTAACAIGLRAEPKPCPACGGLSPRVILTAPALAGMPAAARTAHAVNERAANEPRTSAGHGAGCSCCGPGRAAGGASTVDGHKAFPRKRPWMISH